MGFVLQTATAVVIAVIGWWVGRYYSRKSLGVYRLLNSFAFDGIAPDVRKKLQFRFQDREVHELQQVVLLVANDGERAIRDVIEPLTLTIPAEVEVLDASIIYRQPDGLEAEIVIDLHPPASSDLKFEFPLLNKREFFVVKLLLSGRLNVQNLRILSDDLPRSLKIRPLPPTAMLPEETFRSLKLRRAISAGFVLIIPAWACYVAYLLYKARPTLFPHLIPQGFSLYVSAETLFLFIPFAGIVVFFVFRHLAMLGSLLFGDFRLSPRFQLSKELRESVFPLPLQVKSADSSATRPSGATAEG